MFYIVPTDLLVFLLVNNVIIAFKIEAATQLAHPLLNKYLASTPFLPVIFSAALVVTKKNELLLY